MESSLVNRCPHRSEIQSIVLAETDSKCLLYWEYRGWKSCTEYQEIYAHEEINILKTFLHIFTIILQYNHEMGAEVVSIYICWSS